MDLVYIILAVLLVVILLVLSKYNTLIRAKNRVKNAKANIEIYLNKRFDLIPNLVETVKGYSKHEGETLEKITSLRTTYSNQKNFDLNEAGELNNKLTSKIKELADVKDNFIIKHFKLTYNEALTLLNMKD